MPLGNAIVHLVANFVCSAFYKYCYDKRNNVCHITISVFVFKNIHDGHVKDSNHFSI